MITDWAILQQTQLKALAGCRVNAWRGMEMAFETGDESKPIWRHPSVNAIQCDYVDALTGIDWRRFSTYAGDHPASDDGMVVWDAPPRIEPPDPETSIYRNAILTALPTGSISSVLLDTDAYGMVGCIHLRIGGDAVSLTAAEVYDNGRGGFSIAQYDESVLVRLNNSCPDGGSPIRI